MSLAMRNKFVQQYANNYVETAVTEAKPHKLITLLYQAGIKNLNLAKVFVERKDYAKKAEHVNKVISIIFGLKSGLDMDAGGEVSQNLWDLYDYMARTTFKGSATNDVSKFDEVNDLLKNLLEAWVQMPSDYQNLTQEQLGKMRQQKAAQ
ncbi:MAG: flagellar export chaperone FliS [Methyloprofundus sp.]|nr:flagellar export chaperone FliS [Methyloprofundus sp.]